MVRTRRGLMHLGESSSQAVSSHNQREEVNPNFLNFSSILNRNRFKFERKLKKIQQKTIWTNASVDWEIFKSYGDDQQSIYDDLSTFIDIDYVGEVSFKSRAWRELFSINEPLYGELIQEFYSTFSLRLAGIVFNDENALQFRLGGKDRNLSVTSLAGILGLYPQNIVNLPFFHNFLNSSYITITNENSLLEFWSHIGNGEYNERRSDTLSIKVPILKLFHHLLVNTMTARVEKFQKIHKIDLILLYCFAHQLHVNIPFLIAKFFSKVARKGHSFTIVGGGQYITRIARHFDILNPVTVRSLTLLDPMKILDRNYWIQSGVCVVSTEGSNKLVWNYNCMIPVIEIAEQEQEFDTSDKEDTEDEFSEEVQGLNQFDPIELGTMENIAQPMQTYVQILGNVGVTGGENVQAMPKITMQETTTPVLTDEQWIAYWANQSHQQEAETSTTSIEKKVTDLEKEVKQLKEQLVKFEQNQENQEGQNIIKNTWIAGVDKKLELMSHQMEWIRKRLEQIYPQTLFPNDPWPVIFQIPQPPNPLS